MTYLVQSNKTALYIMISQVDEKKQNITSKVDYKSAHGYNETYQYIHHITTDHIHHT